jgi:predicted nucleic acid-binding protein
VSVYAIDSNIISFYLRGNAIVIANVEKAINGGNSIVIPPLVYYEVKRGLMLINAAKKMKEFDALCQLFPVGELGNYLLEESVNLYVQERKAGRNIEDADIFIATFCINNNYILVTDNIKHFKNIDNLHIINWAL